MSLIARRYHDLLRRMRLLEGAETSDITLTAGLHLGPHEILAPLGSVGMGDVYRARVICHSAWLSGDP